MLTACWTDGGGVGDAWGCRYASGGGDVVVSVGFPSNLNFDIQMNYYCNFDLLIDIKEYKNELLAPLGPCFWFRLNKIDHIYHRQTRGASTSVNILSKFFIYSLCENNYSP